jgi:hypothetical protein
MRWVSLRDERQEEARREKGRTIERRTRRCRFFCLSRFNCLKHPYRLFPWSFHESPSKWICHEPSRLSIVVDQSAREEEGM